MSDPLSELRGLILALSDTAEELGSDATAVELRSIAGGLGVTSDPAALLSRTVVAWCIDARRSRGLTSFAIVDHESTYLTARCGIFSLRLGWGRFEAAETFESGCPPHLALDRLERMAIKVRNAIEEHKRLNPGISRVLDWRPGVRFMDSVGLNHADEVKKP